MKLSVEWLRELVDLPESIDTLCEDLTLLGLEVERVDEVGESFPGVVVGYVVESGPHPNADRLSVCRVDTGDGEVPVVCGAPNVRKGLKVAFAKVGAVLPGDFRIKKSRIRGETSEGMICSEKELGLGEGHEGILELDDDAPLGASADELFGWKDTCIEIEVTPNRPDWLSHIGVARELAAYYQTELRVPALKGAVEVADEDEGWRAVCDDADGCPRYTGRIIHGIGPSETPEWMRRRLLAIGQRPIHPVVDCSNYVLYECGQPNHAFDLSRLEGRTIHVRRAAEGERLVTLDGEERELTPRHLVIADEKKAVALAGLMGGEGTQVSEETTDLLLEVASFDPGTIRTMRRDLVMSTDASYRFERGCDFEIVPWAQQRLTDLITEVCGGEGRPVAFEGRGTPPPAPRRFQLRITQIRRVLGIEIGDEETAGLLQRLEIPARILDRSGAAVASGEGSASPLEGDGAVLEVEQPSFRKDLLEEIDAIEEVARLYGYDRIPIHERAPMLRPAERTAKESLMDRLREHLASSGFHEVMGSSFMEAADPDRLGLAEDDRRRDRLQVLNPLVAGEGYLKSISLPEMLRTVDRNRRRGWTRPIRLFQIDRCFLAREGELLPDEPESLVLLWAGPPEEMHFSRTTRELDPYDALGDVGVLLERLAIDARVEAGAGEAFLAEQVSARFLADGREVGRLGLVHPAVLRRFELEGPVFWAEFPLATLIELLPAQLRYRPIPVYPPVRRDLSLVVPAGVDYAQVAAVLEEAGGEILESHEVFDVYEGKGIEKGSRAVGVRLVLRSAKGTLKDRRVDLIIASMLERLDAALGVKLRAG